MFTPPTKNILKTFKDRDGYKYVLTPTTLYGLRDFDATVRYKLSLSELRNKLTSLRDFDDTVRYKLSLSELRNKLTNDGSTTCGVVQCKVSDLDYAVEPPKPYYNQVPFFAALSETKNGNPKELSVGCRDFSKAQTRDILQAAGLIQVDKTTAVGAALAAKKSSKKKTAKKASKKTSKKK